MLPLRWVVGMATIKEYLSFFDFLSKRDCIPILLVPLPGNTLGTYFSPL